MAAGQLRRDGARNGKRNPSRAKQQRNENAGHWCNHPTKRTFADVLQAVEPVGVVVTATDNAVARLIAELGWNENQPGAEVFIANGPSTNDDPTVGDALLYAVT